MSSAESPKRVHLTFTFEYCGDTGQLSDDLQKPVLDALKHHGVESFEGVEVCEELSETPPLDFADSQEVDIPMSCDEIFELEVDEL